MNNEETKTEQIDRYLDDEMPPAERLAFEQLLLQQEDLRIDVEAQKSVRNYIRQKAQQAELQKLFNGFHREITAPEEENAVIRKIELNRKERRSEWGGMSYFAIAASIALIIVSVWVIVKQDDSIQSEVEIRTNGDRQNFQIPLLVWETRNEVRVKKETRFKEAVIIRDAAHPRHYRFTNTFELYLNPVPATRPKMSLEYDTSTKVYKLWLNGRTYPVKLTDRITTLE